MLVIRFLRTGKKNQPSFKIVVVEKTRSSTSGRFAEEVGFYNPLTKEKVLRGDRIKYWLSVGAKPSPTVYNLLISEKIVVGKKIDVHKKAKEKKGKLAEGAVETPKAEVKKETPAVPAAVIKEPEKKIETPIEKSAEEPVKTPAVEEKPE